MVDVSSISSRVPRSTFSETELENLAELILATGGILKPVILKKVGFEKYEVIDGHFEYYASLKASEKDAVKGEIVNSFIITDEQEAAAYQQIQYLQPSSSSNIEFSYQQRYQEAKQQLGQYLLKYSCLKVDLQEMQQMKLYLELLKIFLAEESPTETVSSAETQKDLKSKYQKIDTFKAAYQKKTGNSLAQIRTWKQVTQIVNQALERGEITTPDYF